MQKPFRTIDEQIETLLSRGLTIESIDDAKVALEYLNYYRLSGYTLTLRKNDTFYPGTKFDDIMQIYNFDKEFKYLLLYHLEEIEVALRTHVGYILGSHGAESYLIKDNYASPNHYDEFMREISNALNDSKNEAFVKHHKSNYDGILPIWALVETLSFGTLSRLFSSLRVTFKKELCELYYKNIRYVYIEQWLESLVVVRNLCAHHSRLFNRGLAKPFSFTYTDLNYFEKSGYERNSIGKKIFFALVSLIRINHAKNSEYQIINGIKILERKYAFVDLKHYGFTKDWEELLLEINQNY